MFLTNQTHDSNAIKPLGIAHALLTMRHYDMEYVARELNVIRGSGSRRRLTGDDLVRLADAIIKARSLKPKTETQ